MFKVHTQLPVEVYDKKRSITTRKEKQTSKTKKSVKKSTSTRKEKQTHAQLRRVLTKSNQTFPSIPLSHNPPHRHPLLLLPLFSPFPSCPQRHHKAKVKRGGEEKKKEYTEILPLMKIKTEIE